MKRVDSAEMSLRGVRRSVTYSLISGNLDGWWWAGGRGGCPTLQVGYSGWLGMPTAARGNGTLAVAGVAKS
jgi:hypothetical protein